MNKLSNNSKTWKISDNLGSVLNATDASGNGVGILTYDEYGIPATGNSMRYQYTGQVFLPELGMYYYKARMYSPSLGRFMQTDPIGYGDGMNWHNYVGGDPVNRLDPSGLRFCLNEEAGTGCFVDEDILITGTRTTRVTNPGSPGYGGDIGGSSPFEPEPPSESDGERAKKLCATKLPDGRTLGEVIREQRSNLVRIMGQIDVGVANVGPFVSIVRPNGSVDFKNNFENRAPFDRETLGTYGNFAYYAIGVGNISVGVLDAGAGAYGLLSVLDGTKPLEDLTGPGFSDRNAAAVRGPGLASQGCPNE